MTGGLLSCTACNEIFRTRSALNNHVRSKHQLSVTVKFNNGSATEIQRGNNDAFNCGCGRSFKLPYSMQKHARLCSGESASAEDASVDEHDAESEGESDASESNDDDAGNDIPEDCFGMMTQEFD